MSRLYPLLSCVMFLAFGACASGSSGGSPSGDEPDVAAPSDADTPQDDASSDTPPGPGPADVTPVADGEPAPGPDAEPDPDPEPKVWPFAEEGKDLVTTPEEGWFVPEFDGVLAWLNTPEPLTLDTLKGHVWVLDFWTYGCVNCLHIMPVLQELEEMYADDPFMVIGMHSGKFTTESEAASISIAIQHYELQHPVAVDDGFTMWNAYNVNVWPSVALVDAEGRMRFHKIGEFLPDAIIPAIEALLQEAQDTGVAAPEPLDLYVDPNEASGTPLLFPGKVLALPDGRVVISDSVHHRLVLVGADGEIEDLVGSGIQGLKDGSFAEAGFKRPQGMCWHDGFLWVADTENHAVRRVDLEERTVTTVAGTGAKGTSWYSSSDGWMDGLETALRSPWDLEPTSEGLAVAMAGSHQIWLLDPIGGFVKVFAGRKFKEGIKDGGPVTAEFAQPSGLALSLDGATLYVADSESSAIRAIDVGTSFTTTIVGTGLFDYGDVDGVGDDVLLQHAVGVEVLPDGLLMVADTYNNKLKFIDPVSKQSASLIWAVPEGPLHQPRGLSRIGDVIYLTDTNNHRVLKYDLVAETGEVLPLPGLEPPALGGFIGTE